MVAANLKMPIWVESFGVKIGWSKSDTLRRTTGVTWCDALRCEIKKIIKGQLSQQPFVRPWLMVREKEKWRTLGCQSRRRERKALDFWGWRAEAEAVTGDVVLVNSVSYGWWPGCKLSQNGPYYSVKLLALNLAKPLKSIKLMDVLILLPQFSEA